MLSIFTDASVADNRAITTCIVLTELNFICYNIFKHNNVVTSLIGELLGALSAVKYTISTVPNVTEAILYTDSTNLVDLLHNRDMNYCLDTFPNNKSEFIELCDLLQKYNIQVVPIKGHQVQHNPNKVVDLVSNSVLGYTK